jgi:hypothetical protein
MNVNRKEVVLVDFPFSGGQGSKVRPALIIQYDRENARLANTSSLKSPARHVGPWNRPKSSSTFRRPEGACPGFASIPSSTA